MEAVGAQKVAHADAISAVSEAVCTPSNRHADRDAVIAVISEAVCTLSEGHTDPVAAVVVTGQTLIEWKAHRSIAAVVETPKAGRNRGAVPRATVPEPVGAGADRDAVAVSPVVTPFGA
ncbi:MAG: hypothetical protein AAF997_21265, partial [Myxococcota bacterium]